jgi:hypothetical protein
MTPRWPDSLAHFYYKGFPCNGCNATFVGFLDAAKDEFENVKDVWVFRPVGARGGGCRRDDLVAVTERVEAAGNF